MKALNDMILYLRHRDFEAYADVRWLINHIQPRPELYVHIQPEKSVPSSLILIFHSLLNFIVILLESNLYIRLIHEHEYS